MDEQNNQNPDLNQGFEKVKKKSKKLKVIIITIIIAVIAVVAVFATLVLTGKLSITKKDKMSDGISKAKETFTKPIEDILSVSTPKITKNINSDSALEFSTEMKASIDKLEYGDLTSSQEKIVDELKDILNGTTLSINGKSDMKNKKFEGTLNAKVDGLVDGISADIVYNDDTIGVRSKEINEKYLTVTTDDIKDVASEEVQEVFDSIDEDQLNEIIGKLNSISITDSEIEHFKSVYDGLFIKQIESDKIEKESGKVKVDGKEKSCTKYVLTLDDDDMKDILNAYVDAFDEDSEGKEIINNKYKALVDIYESAGVDVPTDDLDKILDEGIDELKNSIDEIEFDGEVKITVYATMFNVYEIDFEFEMEGESAVVKMTFNKDNTKVVLDIADYEAVVINITNSENKKEFKITPGKDLKEQANVDFELSILFENNNNEKKYSISGNVKQSSNEMNGKFEAIVTTNKDEDRELDTHTKYNIEFSGDIDGEDLAIALSLDIKANMKLVDSVSVTELTSSNSVNAVKDQAALQQYAQEASTNAQKLIEDISDSDVSKTIQDLYEEIDSTVNNNSYSNSYSNSYNDYYNNSYNDLYNDYYSNSYNDLYNSYYNSLY